MTAHLLQAGLFVTVALAIVLALRWPFRRAFGASPAFALWWLVPTAAMLPWLPLPQAAPRWSAVLAFPASMAIEPLAAPQAHVVWWLLAWAIGAGCALLRLGVLYRRLHAGTSPLPANLLQELRSELAGIAPGRLRLHRAGPAVLWAPRSLVLLPAAFAQQFDPAQRVLVLRHELAHLRHGDALWALGAELALAVLWFHPLAWFARRRFQLDMELACDERVLRLAPADTPAYAQTLLHSVGIAPTPALIPWFTGAQLKERLTMIERQHPAAWRRRLGFLALAGLLAGGGFVANAATPDHAAQQDITRNAAIQPRYPVAAIKAGEQGTVILKVQVHADGSVGTVTYDAKASTTTSADLIAAATDAARQWHFQPQVENGKPVDGYARVPVAFSISPL